VIDAAIPTTIDAATPYALTAVWQTSVDKVEGFVDVGPDGIPGFAGHFADTVMLAGDPYVSAGLRDIVLVRFDPATGVLSAPKQYGTEGDELVTSLSVGGDNDLVIAGAVNGNPVTVGGADFNADQPTPTGFVARYNDGPDHEWSLFMSTNVKESSVDGLSAGAGPVFVCGSYDGKLVLPQTTGDAIEMTDDSTELAAYYGLYDDNGVFQGGQTFFAGEGVERCDVVLDDGLGAAYFAGSYTETIDFSTTLNFQPGTGPPPAEASSASLFVGRINNDTSLQWVVDITGNEIELPIMKGALGRENRLILVSEIQGEIVVPNLDTTLTTGNDPDIALFVVSPVDGEFLSAQSFPSLGIDRANAVAVGPEGQIAMVGRFTGSINFGGDQLQSTGSDDIFVAVFDGTGQHLWSRSFGTTTSDQALSASFDRDGALYVTVRYQNGIDFGLGPLSGVNAGAVIKFE
jgi:hypothetical protein